METTTASLDLIWWITAVELPAMAALFWMNWRNREDFDQALDEMDQRLSMLLIQTKENLAAYKLEVAKSYVTVAYLKDVERRLTGHLLRIEAKLPQHKSSSDGGL